MKIPSSVKKFKKQIPPLPKSIWRNPLHFIAFGFGSGALPFMPGTFGTLAAIPLYLLLQKLPLMTYVGIVILITSFAIWLCDRVEKELKVHDHPGMNVDEIVGYLITMINAPQGWPWIIYGFLLFRLFDIWKPWPIRQVDLNVMGGFGVILDDVLAGFYSLICIQITLLLLAYY